MDISNIQGASAYTANKQAGENTQVQSQESAQTDTTTPESQGAAQKAFEVTITQEARNQMAAETQVAAETPKVEPLQATPPPQDSSSGQQAAHQAPSQIVNIVA